MDDFVHDAGGDQRGPINLNGYHVAGDGGGSMLYLDESASYVSDNGRVVVETKYATIDRTELKQLRADSAELARLRATTSEDGREVPVAYMLADAVGGSVLEFQQDDLLQLQNRYSGEIVPLYAQPARQVGVDIREIVSRFLGWRLPEDFSPDCGISFDGRKDDEWNKNKTWPVGTNLFTADQAKAMFEYALNSAEFAPAAVVMPERKEYPSSATYPDAKEFAAACGEVQGHNSALDEVARLNRRAIPVGLLERIADNLESTSRHRPCTSQAHGLLTELRALLGKEEK